MAGARGWRFGITTARAAKEAFGPCCGQVRRDWTEAGIGRRCTVYTTLQGCGMREDAHVSDARARARTDGAMPFTAREGREHPSSMLGQRSVSGRWHMTTEAGVALGPIFASPLRRRLCNSNSFPRPYAAVFGNVAGKDGSGRHSSLRSRPDHFEPHDVRNAQDEKG